MLEDKDTIRESMHRYCDKGTARSNYLVMMEGPDGPVPSVCAAYADAYTKTPEGWRFQRRELIQAFKGEMRLQLP